MATLAFPAADVDAALANDLTSTLRGAARKIARARFRNAMITIGHRVARIGLLTAAGCAMISVLHAADIGVGRFIAIAAATGVLVASSVAVFSILRVWRTPVLIRDAAERLDLAVANQNAIATAVDLVYEKDGSAFARAAIVAGRHALERSRDAVPKTHDEPARYGRLGTTLGLAALFVGIAYWGASRPLGHAFAAAPRDTTASGRVVANDATFVTDADSPVARPRESSAVTSRTGGSPPAASPAGHAVAGPAAPRAAESPGASATGAGASGSATSPPAEAGPKPLSADSSATPSPSAGDANARPFESPSAGTRSPSGVAGQNPPTNAAGGRSERSAESLKDDTPSRGAGGIPPASPPDDQSQQDAGGAEAGDSNSDQSARSRGASETSSQGTGGDGRAGGENPPKKARGVAPLMLSVREPDLLQGRPLPGPEAKTSLQVPPQPAPQTPQGPAAVAPRQGNESAIDVYRVPAAARTAVARYFEQFHNPPEPGSVPGTVAGTP